jgi:hypothetical protein
MIRFLRDALVRARALRAWFLALGYNEREMRGIKLLREWLTPEQLHQFDKHRYFDVIGCHSLKRYRIHHGTERNICELDRNGHPRAFFCVVPNERLVPGDVMLAQKIGLEADELATLAVARSVSPIPR